MISDNVFVEMVTNKSGLFVFGLCTACELLLYTQKASQSLRPGHPHRSSVPLSCHRLRVLSAEQRHAWYSILEHRLSMCQH